MKKNLSLLNLALIVLLLTSCQFQAGLQEFALEISPTTRLSEEYRSLLPEDAVIPETLPALIHDPLLLATWIYLYNQTQPFQVWDGRVLTGKILAQFIMEYKIPVRWNSIDLCDGNSCTPRKVCYDDICLTNKEIGDYPIYIALRYQDNREDGLAALAGSLAHETYHHMEPHGKVSSTLFEEYWAYYVGKQISKDPSADFTGYKPLNPACLKLWFFQNNHMSYFLDMYPIALQSLVDDSNPNCSLGVH